MGGGLLQLTIKGQMDSYVSTSPDISFYKFGYKKYTNFSMESINLSFDVNPVLSSSSLISTYNCKIGRYGDLLTNLYFCYTLPEIYSSDIYRFKWINNIGSLIIKKAIITVGNTIIDSIVGEWLVIWNELILTNDYKNNYNKMTGNIDSVINPSVKEPIIGIKNNKFYKLFYPSSTLNSSTPSINSTNIRLPLNFWFCRNSALALPLLQLQNSDIYITIQIENSENLYQVWSKDLNLYVSPIYYNQLYNDNINISTFILNNNLLPSIEANYVFLDTNERNSILTTPTSELLVEQLEINNSVLFKSSANSTISINLNLHKLVKEIIWTLKRDDYINFNENTNYTASIPENDTSDILNKANIVWNNANNRVDEKDAVFFNKIQPYQHHSCIPKLGIYSYSFGLYPEKYFPTGCFNAASIITNLTLDINGNYNNDKINNLLNKINKNPYNFGYICNVYTKSYNVFSIIGGIGTMKYV